MSYHVDKKGNEIHGDVILQHNDGSFYEPFGTGLRLPGDGSYICVFRIDGNRQIISGGGIAGTSITYVNTKEVAVYDPWVRFYENVKHIFTGWFKSSLTVK